MNGKQLSLLVVLGLVLAGAALLLNRGNHPDTAAPASGSGNKLLGKFNAADVAHIVIKQDTNEINLTLKDDVWHLRERSDYPANFTQISELANKFVDLKVLSSEPVGAPQLTGLHLALGQGTNSPETVDFRDKGDKTIQAVLLGKFHMHKMSAAEKSRFGDMGGEGYPDGRYVMRADDTKTLLLVSDPLSNYEPKPEQWLNKDFFRIEKPKSLSVARPEETNSWKIARDSESNAWQMLDAKPGENVDTNKLPALSTAFASASFNDITNGSPADTGLDKPTVVTIETFDGFTYTAKVGKKFGEDYPLTIAVTATFAKERPPVKDEKPEDKAKADKEWKDHQKQLDDTLAKTKAYEKWTYLVPSWSVDNFIKDRKDLLVEKKEEPKTDAAADKKDDAKDAGSTNLAPGALDLIKQDQP